ncbi:hypothetical protein RRG08_002210 [Elysia crispata]|uniref:Uncharacterized protein n=1 Tax=Elysia crispata TaxID=231223 RepID=A0AAE0ZAT0_9GAST|nr:hypothetical protein RRG08_002210 [Elysia crispata]
MPDVKTVTLYKSKGDCNNYRGLSLLRTVSKAFAGVVSTSSNSSLTEFTHSLSADIERKDPKDTTSTITIGEQILEVVDKVTYLGSTISNNLSLDAELNVRIDKASTIMVRLLKRVLDNTMLTFNIKMRVYQACVLSTLLYGSES